MKLLNYLFYFFIFHFSQIYADPEEFYDDLEESETQDDREFAIKYKISLWNEAESQEINQIQSPIRIKAENRLNINDVRGNQLENAYLLCRTISQAPEINRIIHVVIEDPGTDMGATLTINNRHKYFSYIPIGTKFLLMDPKATNDSTEYEIRIHIEDPRDILLIQDDNPILQSFEWEGTLPPQDIDFSKYVKAIEFYSEKIKRNRANIELRINRAVSYFNLGFYRRALEDVDVALKLAPTQRKLIHLKVESLLKSHRYSDAVEFLESDPVRKDRFDALLKRAKGYQIEHQTGDIDVKELEQMSSAGNAFEVAEFISNSIELVKMPVKGRGMIATKFIPAGTLIVASRIFAEEQIRPAMGDFTLETLAMKLAVMLKIEPEKSRELYMLSAGGNLGHLDLKEDETAPIDLKRINDLLGVNSFEISEEEKAWVRTWGYPVSYFNHDCIENNIEHTPIDEWMFLRTNKDVNPGSELTISYKDPSEVSDRTVGFNCTCRLCVADKSEPEKVRVDIEEAIKAANKAGDTAMMEELIYQRLDNVNQLELAQFLVPWLYRLADLTTEKNEFKKAVKYFKTLVHITGERVSAMSHAALTDMMGIMNEHKDLFSGEEIKEYSELFYEQEAIIYGGVDMEEDEDDGENVCRRFDFEDIFSYVDDCM